MNVRAPFSSAALPGLDLAPLYQERILASRERKETYSSIAGELCDYGLCWRGGVVDALAYRARMGAITIYSMRYGDEVAITPDLYRDFMLVHVSLRKGIEVEADGQITHVPEGAIFFSAPQDYIRLRWEEHCEQLIVRVPLDLALGTERPRNALRTSRILAATWVPLFVSQLNMALNLSRQTFETDQWDAWMSHVEQGLARFAGLQLFDTCAAGRPAKPVHGEDRDRRERLQEFIFANLVLPLTLDDLASAVHLGRSQLNALCQQSFGCSPMMLVRRMRLDAARADLERTPAQDLTKLSLRFGFEHQSRFAQYYHDAFGELPSDTRRRLR